MICEAFGWPQHDFAYLRIGKAASRTLVDYFHDRDGAVEGLPVDQDFSQYRIRFAVIRHPIARVLSYWADAKHRDMPFDYYVDKIPDLAALNDPHVTPFSGIEKKATHLFPLETMDIWWTLMQRDVPALFHDRPEHRKGVSKLPKPTPTESQLAKLLNFYFDDIRLWERCIKS